MGTSFQHIHKNYTFLSTGKIRVVNRLSIAEFSLFFQMKTMKGSRVVHIYTLSTTITPIFIYKYKINQSVLV